MEETKKLRIVSANVRMGRNGLMAVGSRDEGVDIYLIQEAPLTKGGNLYGLDNYEMIGGMGGGLEVGRGSVVETLIHKRWEGKWKVKERKRCKIGIVLEVSKGRKLEIWNIYIGQGKHREFGWVEGDGNVVVMGDVNAQHERWGGDGIVENREGRRVAEWMDEWGFVLGTPRGEVTRIDPGRNGTNRVLDIGVWVGGLEVEGNVWEGIVGMDHKPIEMKIKILGMEMEKEEEGWGRVDWERVEAEWRLDKDWEDRWVESTGGRKELDKAVERLEEYLKRTIKENRGRRKWKGGRKRWWTERVEESHNKTREAERRWERTRGETERSEMEEKRREFKRVVEEEKGKHWKEYLESLKGNEGFKWVKSDRDFVVDIPPIEVEGGIRVEEEGEKGEAIIRGLGKREDEDQEEEGGEWDVELDEEEVEEALLRQKDKKAAGMDELGGKVYKILWRIEEGRRTIMAIYRRSLELGYVPERFRKSVGIVMRKPNKADYGLPGSYRIINLLDVLGKGLERIVCGRLELWGQEGMGDEQFGARKGRSSMDAVGKLYKCWEEGGKRGLLLCMDVQGGFENVGVRKMMERLTELKVDEYLKRWISSFLREREVVVKIGKRLGKSVRLKGGTVQGSPLSPVLFMLLLGGVLEEVKRERIEGMKVVAVVDDVDFMIVGKEEEILEKMKKMEEALERGLKRWEIDVQVMKLEGMWMGKDRMEWERGVKWLGNDIKMRLGLRVLGVWFQCNGGWREHVVNRIRIAEGRWRMMLKLLGRGGRGASVEVLKKIFKMVVGQTLMYGMELYWEGQDGMRDMLQKWWNKGMRKILGAVRTTPVDAMLGELGWKRVEYELDRKVERWGMRILRRGIGEDFGENWKCLEKERAEIGRRDWVGRLIRGVRRHKLEDEKFEIERERGGRLKWKIKMGEGKEKRKKEWEEGRREREENWIVGIGDASGEGTGIGVGGGWYEGGKLKNSWSKNLGRGWTVGEGEMEGVGECLKRIEAEYEGEKKKVIVGVDNKGVLWRLRKGRGVCGEAEQRVRMLGRRMIEKGWEVRIEWVPGHVEIEENEEADERAKEGSWDDDEDEETRDVLVWGKWEQRRKEFESRRWKEYWTIQRKGEEYFGTGAGGERGHGGKRWESKFLFWMRTNHGGMGGSRYMKGRSLCKCGGVEDRDHIILYCDLWKKEREEVWKGWWKGAMGNEGWVDMDRLLFGKEGTKRLIEFGKRIGWMERNWEVGRIEGEERRKGMLMKPWKEKGGGWLGERLEERRREILESARLRMRRLRERRREEARNLAG